MWRLERWCSKMSEDLVLFPAPTWQPITICNSYSGLDPSSDSYKHCTDVAHIHAGKTTTYIKEKRNRVVSKEMTLCGISWLDPQSDSLPHRLHLWWVGAVAWGWSEGNCWETVFYFHHVDSGHWVQVVNPGCQPRPLPAETSCRP